jgi:hypothetical protein
MVNRFDERKLEITTNYFKTLESGILPVTEQTQISWRELNQPIPLLTMGMKRNGLISILYKP